MHNSHTQTPSLADLQHWLKWIFTDPRDAGDVLTDRDAGPRPEPSVDCERAIRETSLFPRAERLEVYSYAFLARLVECLEEDYLGVRAILGKDSFWSLVSGYVGRFPSRSPTATDLGIRFVEFLGEQKELLNEHPYLTDLARLEWALVKAFYAPESPALDFSKLGTLPPNAWASAVLILDSSVQLISSRWDVFRYWAELETNRSAIPIKQNQLGIVFREKAEGTFETLDLLQYEVLSLVSRKRPLSEICERITELSGPDSPPPPVMDWFSTWASQGIVCDVRFDSNRS